MPPSPQSSPPDTPLPDPRDYVQDGAVLIGCGRRGHDLVPGCIELRLPNWRGLVTGAPGTGKTVTLQVLAEGFSAAGVPVFAADIKGDLSGLGAKGEPKANLIQRAQDIGLARYGNAAFPVAFWDVLGEQGHPVRATVQEMGPLLLSRLLELTEPQEGVLNIAFKWAEDERSSDVPRMEILHLNRLRGHRAEMGKNTTTIRTTYTK